MDGCRSRDSNPDGLFTRGILSKGGTRSPGFPIRLYSSLDQLVRDISATPRGCLIPATSREIAARLHTNYTDYTARSDSSLGYRQPAPEAIQPVVPTTDWPRFRQARTGEIEVLTKTWRLAPPTWGRSERLPCVAKVLGVLEAAPLQLLVRVEALGGQGQRHSGGHPRLRQGMLRPISAALLDRATGRTRGARAATTDCAASAQGDGVSGSTGRPRTDGDDAGSGASAT